MSKSVSDFVLSGNCFYEQICFMLAYCANSIADLVKPCGDLDLEGQVTKSPYAMACLHLRAVHDAFLMESDGRTLCLHMLIRKPTGNSHMILSILFWFPKVAPSDALDNPTC